MSRTVFCRKYQRDMEGMAVPPLPGAKGKELQDNVSKQAWEEWQAQQTRLINEKHLSLLDPEARAYLMEQMERFLDNRETDQAEGFVPPSESR
ncbi:oxidative damage protection protein [Halomonas sp. WWR20]